MPDRATPAVPTASLADIGFLLLVFFLVATTIATETGLPATLPRVGGAPKAVAAGTLLAVDVRADGAVALNGEPVEASAVRALVAAHAAGPEPHVALRAARATPYADYVAALDAILLGHRDAGATPRLTLREPVE